MFAIYSHVSLRMKDVTFEPVTIVNEWMLKESNMSSMFAEYQKTSRQYCLDHDGSLKMSKDINELLYVFQSNTWIYISNN